MKKTNGFSFYHLVVICVLLVILGSCVSQKQVKYLQQQQKNNPLSTFQNHRTSDYRIQSHDALYIKVYGLDEKSYLFFNKESGISGNFSSEQTPTGLYLDSYVVDDSGYVDFPLAGKIYVKDMTVDNAKVKVQTVVNEYLKNSVITMKLVSFNINVLGEIRKPGNYPVYQDKLNVFEAISLAGDLTDFADRHKVALIRQTHDGSRVIYLDLNSIEILHSEYYYLEPNDILYFAPLGIKRWGTETFPWALLFAAITTTLLLINYLKL
jgi:polysaccharide export outer membrane protein